MTERPDWTACEIHRADGSAPVVLVCEHASRRIPADLDGLGLNDASAQSHAAWDIGALDVAKGLSDALDAVLVAGGVSRLVYDCNRPPEAPDAIPARSEIYDIPGNAGMAADQRDQRVTKIHDPFHDAVAKVMDTRPASALITIHSFTPVYNGKARATEIGFLHDASADLAQAALAVESARGRFRCALNEPYAASDGVTYTLRRHGESRGLPALMIEIRNDLIATPADAATMAQHLAETLGQTLALTPEAAR